MRWVALGARATANNALLYYLTSIIKELPQYKVTGRRLGFRF